MSAPAIQSTQFSLLSSPIDIGRVTVKNRIVSSGHDTGMSVDSAVSDQLVAYHRARAAGGVGLIVLQVSGIHETARYTTHMLMATDDSAIDGYRRIAEAVHPYGTKVFGQVFHPGREMMESLDGSRPVAYSASNAINDRFHQVPAAMPKDMIDEVITGYADGAERMRKGGLDGTEIVASHGYLPAQFLNARFNQRTDEYGGSYENRLRFLRDTVRAVRDRVGPDFVVGLRISGEEMSEDGLVIDEVVQACRDLDADGLLDYISVTAGTSATLGGAVHIVPPMSQQVGYTAPISAQIKKIVDVPVMVAGRVNQPQDAETVLANGQADLCAMTRALICDPEMPNKALDGELDSIRACIGCNQACIGHHHAGYPISCIQRPESGRELVYDLPNPVVRRKSVMVIGGGPAGLKAATVAAQRGHEVTLYEAERRVGGQVLLAEQLPGRAEFGGAATNIIAEAQRAGVNIVTRHRVDGDFVRASAPDAVIVATGSVPRQPEIEIMDEPTILEARDVVGGVELPHGRIVIADWRCDWIGLGVAQMIVQKGRKAVLCVDGYMAGEMLQQYVRDDMLAAAHAAGVEIVTNVRVMGVDEDTVYLQHRLSGQPVMVEDVAATVFSLGPLPENSLVRELDDVGCDVIAIGDAVAPRTVEEAILEGLKAAWNI
ncbi:oxidoreductase [Gordonia hydrophobica]|uniref:FAD-dependent oxidoreductase n=1 Tax=Gordonia hydrophobica TaxID=40516 RepID=A0ABZ2U2U1_9ACTN|nr:FAD-dependent oxidoreductase [Gordonia hydrophobica]MBM7369049.1 2,4-dienoyl-CoA reductase-like NADH-dependent reductase (Old Yellow Enzyme family)/thioredoxin reductase [Gordonia hydrophobica]